MVIEERVLVVVRTDQTRRYPDILGCETFSIEAHRCVLPDQSAGLILIDFGATRLDSPEARDQYRDMRQMFGEECGVAALSDIEDPSLPSFAIHQGYCGYLPTCLPSKLLNAAMKVMLAGGIFVPNEAVGRMAEANSLVSFGMDHQDKPALPDIRLTPRELQMLEALQSGMSNKVIAHTLSIAESTVKAHLRHLMIKFNVKNRTQLVLLGLPYRSSRRSGSRHVSEARV